MNVPCAGICSRYRASKPAGMAGRYATGQSRCQTCSMFINWDGLLCPCCGMRLRKKPRAKKYKRMLQVSGLSAGRGANVRPNGARAV